MAKELKVAELYTELKLDTKHYTAALTRSKKSLETFQKEISDSNNKMKRTITALTKSMDGLGSSFDQLAGKDRFKSVKSDLAAISKQITKLQKDIGAKTTKSGLESAMEKTAAAAREAEAAIKKANAAAAKKVIEQPSGASTEKPGIQQIQQTKNTQKKNVQTQLEGIEQIKTAAVSASKEVIKMQEAVVQSTAPSVEQIRRRLADMNRRTGANSYMAEEEALAAAERARRKRREVYKKPETASPIVEPPIAATNQPGGEFGLTEKGQQLINERASKRPQGPPRPRGRTIVGQDPGVAEALNPSHSTALTVAKPQKIALYDPADAKRTMDDLLGIKKAMPSYEKPRREFKQLSESMRTALNLTNGLNKTHQEVAAQVEGIRKTWKNVGNIVKGIVISQTFYRGLRVLQNWVTETLNMSKLIEVTQSSYATMVGDAAEATKLMQYTQDFAANTAFTFQTAADGARQLLAYGFQLENVGYLMNVIGDTASAMGDPEAFNRVAKALGQIQTKGKLATQEMLQLTEAGIPAFEILEDKLGLTKEQLGNIGKTGIDSNTAITALVEGLSEKYSGSMKNIAQTTEGLQNNIMETFHYIGVEAFKPLTAAWKEKLQSMSGTFESWLKIIRTTGVGGLFEHLVPPELQDDIRQLLANVVQLAHSIGAAWRAAQPFTQIMMQMGMQIANLVLPVFTAINYALSYLANALTATTGPLLIFRGLVAGLTVLLAVSTMAKLAAKSLAALKIVGALVVPLSAGTTAATLFASAITFLKSALAGPFGIPVAIAGVSAMVATLAAAGSAVTAMSRNLGTATGALGDKYLQPVYNEAIDTTDMYGTSIRESVEATEDLGDATEEAGKKAKKAADGLLAFDEVFQLPDELDDTTGPDVGAPNFGDIAPPMPNIPDFKPFVEEYTKNFDNAMAVGFKPKTDWSTMWDEVKSGFKQGLETFGGILGAVGHIFTTVYEIIRAGVRSIITIFDGDATTLAGIWAECGAKISVSWAKVWSNLKGETEKAMRILRGSTKNGMQGVTETYEYALATLPNITEDNIGEAASTFTKLLRALDDDAITVLRGTSDTMAQLFAGISANMSEDEAMKVFTKNIQIMSDAGSLDIKTLQEDIGDAMTTIKTTVITELEAAQKGSNILMSTMSDNMKKSSGRMASELIKDLQGMSGTTVEVLAGMGGAWGLVFDGITADSDLESKATKDLVTANIEKMKQDGTYNVSEMAANAETLFIKMAQDADTRTKELANSVNTGTFDASVFAGVNATLINENINQALDTLPDQTKATLASAKNKMVEQLVAAGVLTKSEGEQIVKGLIGTLDKIPGESATIFGIDLRAAIKEVEPIAVDAFLSFGAAVAKALFKGIWDNLSDTIFSASWWMSQIKKGIGNFIGNQVNVINELFGGTIGKSSGGRSVPESRSYGAPEAPGSRGIGVPHLARGGIVQKDTLARIGENNRREAVIPLENGNALEIIADKIVEALGRNNPNKPVPVGGSSYTPSPAEEKQILYVGTLIADDRGLRELDRKMTIVRQGETKRRG